ncbi:MAG: VOC family protein [Flavobacteriales bacterium]
MELGTSYNALNVKDIRAAWSFYKHLGFEPVTDGGSVEEKWLILKNGNVKIGLFEGMFPRNIMTINPPDVRSVYYILKAQKADFLFASKNIDESVGKCSFMVRDPDGNPILFDQLND